MHVLVPVDTSDPARKALAHVLTTIPDADVTVLHVIDPTDSSYVEFLDHGAGEWMEAKRERAAQLLAEFETTAEEYDRSVTTEAVVGKPAREIVTYVDEHPIDQVVIGSHGRSGVTRVLLGSVADTVVRRAPVPVTVVR